MSTRLLAGIATLASTVLVSCYPYPEDPYMPPPGHVPPPGHPSITSREQQEIQRQREEARERQAQRQQQTERRESSSESERPSERESASRGESSGGTSSSRQESSGGTRPADYPFATPVVGQEGFVLSPYNQKKIDVRGIATGTLVRDPTYPEEEKKFFRVP